MLSENRKLFLNLSPIFVRHWTNRKTMFSNRKNLWLIHLAGWLLFLVLPLTILSRGQGTDFLGTVFTSWSFWLFFLIYCGIFYLNLLVLIPGIYLAGRYTLYGGIFVAGLVAMLVFQPFDYLIFQRFGSGGPGRSAGQPQQERVRPPHEEGPAFWNPPQPPSPPDAPARPLGERQRTGAAVDFVSVVLFMVVWGTGMLYRISAQWRQSEKQVLQSETERAQAELSFFKAQINPHFLFNTLNNIYSLALTQSDATASSILKLSGMLRYIADEASSDFVPLGAELDCLNSYIDLQKLRLTARTTVFFGFPSNTEPFMIPPLMLMTFVENAFKYGVSNSQSSEIRIEIAIRDGRVLFNCENAIFGLSADQERKGIGIANTRKRLELLFPGDHVLDVLNTGSVFRVRAEIPLTLRNAPKRRQP